METETQELQTVKQETDQMIQEAKALAITIKDPTSYQKAGEFWLRAKAMEKRVKAYFEPMKKSAKAVHTEICNKEAEALKRASESTAILSPAMQKYENEQERQRQEAERKANEASRKQEEEARLHAAIEVEATGDREGANQILETPSAVAPIEIPKQKFESEVGAIHTREQWSARVINLRELVAGILRGEAAITCIEPNMTVLNQMARAMKDQAKIPGIQFVKETIRVGRTI